MLPLDVTATVVSVESIPFTATTTRDSVTFDYGVADGTDPLASPMGVVDVTDAGVFLCSGQLHQNTGQCTVDVSSFPDLPVWPYYTHNDIIATYEGAPGYAPSSGSIEFTVVGAEPAPAVVNIAPGSGPTAGGTVVSLVGNNFDGATGVTFGAAGPAESFSVISDTEMDATSPPGVNTVPITVTTADGGTSVPSPGGNFTYLAPRPPAPAVVNHRARIGADHGWNGGLTHWDQLHGSDCGQLRGSGSGGIVPSDFAQRDGRHESPRCEHGPYYGHNARWHICALAGRELHLHHFYAHTNSHPHADPHSNTTPCRYVSHHG